MIIKDMLGLGNKALEGREKTTKAGAPAPSRGSTPAADAGAEESSDKVALSGRSRNMAKAKEAAGNSPEVREDLVAEIKRRIANNEYDVSSDKLAEKMIVGFLNEIL